MGNKKSSSEKNKEFYSISNDSNKIDYMKSKSNESTKDVKKQIVTIEGVKYEILEKVGQGGFGTVFKARNKSDIYAIKTIQLTSENKNSIYAEIQFIIEIRKKFPKEDSLPIVKVFGVEIVESNNLLYYAMEFASGTLEEYLLHLFSLDKTTSLSLMKIVFLHVLKSLLFLQSIDVTHSDIKPENFIYLEDPSNPFKINVKLIDFGTVKKIDEKESKLVTSSIGGTIAFIAPEAFKDIVHKKSDMWSFGIMIYSFIYKELPPYCKDPKSVYLFASNSTELYFPKCDSLFDEMLDICKKCLTKNTNKRYSALDLYMEVNKNWSICKTIIPYSYVNMPETKSLCMKYSTMKSKQCFICNVYMSNSHKHKRCNDCFRKRCLDCYKLHPPDYKYKRCYSCYRKRKGV